MGKNVALVGYMLDHNEHHAEELVGVAEKLKAVGSSDAAAEILAGVEEFKKGNARLAKALEILKAQA